MRTRPVLASLTLVISLSAPVLAASPAFATTPDGPTVSAVATHHDGRTLTGAALSTVDTVTTVDAPADASLTDPVSDGGRRSKPAAFCPKFLTFLCA